MTVLIEHFNLQDLKILYGAQEEIYTHIKNQINKEKLWIVTLNALMYMEYMKDNDYSKAIKNASFSIPDGIGIVKLLKRKGIDTERCPGIDTMNFLLNLSKEKGYGVYLLGSFEESVKKAVKTIENDFKIKVSGYHNGYFEEHQEEEIVKNINESKADLLFVGMGIPKQEIFIFRNYKKLNVKLMMGVGGSFDVIGGSVKRAPAFYQKLGLEWLYRMFEEPHRFKKLPILLKFYINLYRKNN